MIQTLVIKLFYLHLDVLSISIKIVSYEIKFRGMIFIEILNTLNR